MTKGEELRVTIHYDLFGVDVHRKKGLYISTSSSGKMLLYFPKFCEWGEFLPDQVKRVDPGVVTQKSMDFVSRVKKMESTLPTGSFVKAKL